MYENSDVRKSIESASDVYIIEECTESTDAGGGECELGICDGCSGWLCIDGSPAYGVHDDGVILPWNVAHQLWRVISVICNRYNVH